MRLLLLLLLALLLLLRKLFLLLWLAGGGLPQAVSSAKLCRLWPCCSEACLGVRR
jgi:hypothetical protein